MSIENRHLPIPHLSDAQAARAKLLQSGNQFCDPEVKRLPIFEDELRGYEAIAEYRYGNRKLWRRVAYLCSKGRFPFFIDGSIVCARRSTIDLLITLQEYYSLLGRKWTVKEVERHFGIPAAHLEKAKGGTEGENPHSNDNNDKSTGGDVCE